MPRIRLLASSLALAICSITAAQAQQFDGFVSFGDSLSDDGNIAAVENANFGLQLPPGTSFTSNPDPVTVKIIAAAYGFDMTNSLAGGTDFAFGGACVQAFSASFDCVNDSSPNDSFSITNQVTGFITAGSGHVDPNTLYTMWGGANDIFTYASEIGSDGGGGEGEPTSVHPFITPQQAAEGVALSSATEVGLISSLQTAGAKNIIVFNLPNVALTPEAAGQATALFNAEVGAGVSPAQAQADAQALLAGLANLSIIYNNVLNQGMAGKTGIIPVNVFGLVNEVFANHDAYGFTNITDPACGAGASSVLCGPNGDPHYIYHYDPATIDSFFFADGVHPTGAGHNLLAQYVLAEVAAPAYTSMLAETPLQVFETQNRAIHDQMEADMGGNRPDGNLRSFASIDYSHQRFDMTATSPEMTTRDETLVMGADYNVNSSLSFGLSTTISHQDANFGGGGSFENNEPMGAAWMMWHTPDWYVSVLGSVGQLNFNGIDRDIQLGTFTRVETASTGGSHMGAQLAGGYWFHFGDVKTGPFASVSHQRVRVSGFEEWGNDSTAMVFGRQERDSTLSEIGWELTGEAKAFGGFHPFARVAYDHESDADPRLVSAGLVGMNGTFSMPGYQPDSSYWTAQLGIATELSENFHVFGAYSGHFGDSNERVDSFNLGVKWSW